LPEIEQRNGAARTPSPQPSPQREAVEPRRNGGPRVIRQPDLLAGE
jgi:hypothetical protein